MNKYIISFYRGMQKTMENRLHTFRKHQITIIMNVRKKKNVSLLIHTMYAPYVHEKLLLQI